MKQPILQFDFNDSPIVFSHPSKIIQTNKLTEVNECLQQVQLAADNGYYVAGYISYEATYAFTEYIRPELSNEQPLLWFGLFRAPNNEPIVYSNNEQYSIGQWDMLQSKEQYDKQFAQIMKAIQQGQVKQVNYTVPFESNFSGNTYHYYERLKKAQQAAYNAYLQLGNFEIISASPELFFHMNKQDITVKPMKGTIHRGKTVEEDLMNKQWLETSAKNKYENKLISQLMLTELTPITQKDSLQISKLYEVEQYPTVYQMTSTIQGTLLPETTATEIMKTLFPCGSITGVPKDETIRFIADVEPFPREVYCGAIGYITPNKEAIFNVPIRTVTIDRKRNRATYGAGGAITAHSNVKEEYEEMLAKTNVLELQQENFQLLETIALMNGEYLVLDEHMERLLQSANYFRFPINIHEVKNQLQEVAQTKTQGEWRVRLTVSEQGKIEISYQLLSQIDNSRIRLAEKPIDKENLFHYHKTTNRTIYDQHKPGDDFFDVLLWNEYHEVTEFTIGNVVVEIDGEFYTPPIICGVLPGTYRASLLKCGEIKEKVILKTDLERATNIWFINSVRGWIKVHF